MRDCPQCSNPVDGPICLGCGYSDTPAPPMQRDPLALACAFMDRGWRCTKPGSVSNGIHGGGPWYCGEHARVVQGGSSLAHEDVDPEGLKRVRAAIAQAASMLRKPKKQPKQWAHDILAAAARGEYKHAYGIESARRVVGDEAQHEANEERAAIQGERPWKSVVNQRERVTNE